MKIISDKFLTGAMYAPFCRTLHAPMEEWDRDMANMAKLGYTCLHGFAEWHDVEYEKGWKRFRERSLRLPTFPPDAVLPADVPVPVKAVFQPFPN